MNLKTIIEQSKKKSTKAQRLLFDLTCDQLNSVALRYMGSTSLAEDVLQESYIRIFQNLNSFKYINDAATYGWMRQITAMEAIRNLKKNKRWLEIQKEVIPNPSVDSPVFQDELFQVLLTLTTQQRLVFNLFALEGYSHKEIGDQLGIAESSSRSLLTRARQHLQSQLTKYRTYEKV